MVSDVKVGVVDGAEEGRFVGGVEGSVVADGVEELAGSLLSSRVKAWAPSSSFISALSRVLVPGTASDGRR